MRLPVKPDWVAATKFLALRNYKYSTIYFKFRACQKLCKGAVKYTSTSDSPGILDPD